MVKVRPLGQAQTNYSGSASKASVNYRAGVQAASDWQARATSASAESNYASAVAEAVSTGRRAKALSRVSNSDWQNRASTKGAAAIGPAISGSADKWAKGFSPYSSALEGVSLPDRTTDGLSNLTARAGAIVSALEAKKKELKG